MEDQIRMVHGSGGSATNELISDLFAKAFQSDTLDRMEDCAIVAGTERIAVTTDSFVVTPVEFPGGDIGRLSVCGTVNDLLMRGAQPKYLTCGFILQEGTSIATLRRVVESMAETAREARVQIVAGDTKVVNGSGEFYINTTGVGIFGEDRSCLDICAAGAKAGDAILVSGNLGDHHAAILSGRMGIRNQIASDCAPLCDMVERLIAADIHVHAMRDVTRGGLATVLKELAEASQKTFTLEQGLLPITSQVQDFCGLLGLDPLYMGNEGKLVAVLPEEEAERAVSIMREAKYGEHACRMGTVTMEEPGKLLLKTKIGGLRSLDVLMGEGLPRIC